MKLRAFVQLIVLLAGIAAMELPGTGRAQSLSADLSSHIIGITTGFVGADLVLFGSIDRPGDSGHLGDIVVVVRGPASDIMIRRKQRIAGIWINGSRAVFRDAPTFYALAATRPLADIAPPELMARQSIGLTNIRLLPTEPIEEPQLAAFRAALLNSEQATNLYRADITPVRFVGPHLFRADMNFPANVPTGSYSVEVFLFVDGQLVAAQTTPLVVGRIGFSNGVVVAAHRHAVLYGAGALIFAVAAGWVAGAIFRRV
jgi:uncharacterized protein (TIGR02186 family)